MRLKSSFLGAIAIGAAITTASGQAKTPARAEVVGTAATAFTFKDFGLEQPRVPVVLSVADTIRLEYDFRLMPDPKP